MSIADGAALHRFHVLLIVTKAGLECRLVPGKDLEAVCTAVQQRVVSLLKKEGDEEGSELKALAAWAWHATMHVAYGLSQVMCRCCHLPYCFLHVVLLLSAATLQQSMLLQSSCVQPFMDPRQQAASICYSACCDLAQ